MDTRSPIFGLAALAAILATLRVAVPARPGPEGAPAAPPRTVVDSVSAYSVGAQLIAESCVGEERGGLPFCRHNPVNVRIFIATVPDARDPLLDWMYDESVEAIRRGFEKADYLLDRFWEARASDSVHVGGAKAAERKVAANHVHPGAMLLRHREDPTARALVYLVAETPTSGIAHRAFANALAERAKLRARRDPCGVIIAETDTIRVIGPTYSGSAASLAAVLRRHRNSGDRSVARVVTGTATSRRNARTLELPDSVTFDATLHDDDTVLSEVAAVLDRLGIDPDRVAVLRETTTAYGLNAADADAGTARNQWRVIPFPLNIATVRNEYARNPEPKPSGTEQLLPARRTAAVGLESPLRTSTTIPPVSGLTPAAQDRVLDEIVQALRRERVQAVGIIATDIRDKVFLASLLRRRLRDVLLFTTEANSLLLGHDRVGALRGMLVFGSYPLYLESQRWMRERDRGSTRVDERLAFGAESQIGLYNATLLQLGRMEDSGLLYGTVADTPRAWPPVWVSVVGARGYMPVEARTIASPAYAFGGPRSPEPTQPGPALAAGVDVRNGGHYMAMNVLHLTGFMALILFGLLAVVFYVEPGLTQGAMGWRNWRDGAVSRVRNVSLVAVRRPPGSQSIPRARADSPRIWPRIRHALGPDQVAQRLRQAVSLARDDELVYLELDLHVWGVARLFLFVAVLAPVLVLAYAADALHSRINWVAGLALALGLTAVAVAVFRLARVYCYAGQRVGEAVASCPSERLVRQGMLLAGFGYAVLFALFTISLARLARGCSGSTCEATFEQFFHRAIAFDSGVSPMVPTALGAAILFFWTGWHLGRTRGLRGQTVLEGAVRRMPELAAAAAPSVASGPVPAPPPGGLRRVAAAMREARWTLFSLVPRRSSYAVSLMLIVPGAWFAFQFDRSLETLILPAGWFGISTFDWLFRASVLVAFGSVTWAIVRMHQAWGALRAAFERIADTPILAALTKVRAEIGNVAVPSLVPSIMNDAALSSVEKQFNHARIDAVVARRWPALLAQLHSLPGSERGALGLSSVDFQCIANAGADWNSLDIETREMITGAICLAVDGRFTGKVLPKGAGEWLDRATEFVAFHTAAYCEWGQQLLRRLALFLLLALILTTLMLSSYPFQPQHLFKLALIGLAAATVAQLFLVTVEMNRDEVLSALTNSTAGRIEWNTRFVLNLVVFGAVPILTLLSSELPVVRTALVGWIQPFVRAAANF